jgi:hypothetical protein
MTLDELRALSEAATKGPWRWHGQVGRYIDLTTVGDGLLTVMSTKRLGMQGAEPVFYRREPDAPWGWNGNAEPASSVAVREVPYRRDIVDIDNPNARLIVAAVNFVREMLDRDDEIAARHTGGD